MDDKIEDAITPASLPRKQIKKINPNRPLAEIIQDLSKRVPEHLLSTVPLKWFEAQKAAQDRENRECRKRHYPLDLLPYDVPHKYIPWYNAVRILNHYAPGWIGEIRNIAVPGKSANTFVTVVYRITVKGSDGEVCREASATSTMDYGDHSVYFSPVQNAEREAFCRRRRSWSSDSIGSDYGVRTEDVDDTVSVESGSSKSSVSAETSTRVRGVLSGLNEEALDESNNELRSERSSLGRAKRRKLRHRESVENSEESEDDSSDEEGSSDEVFNQLGNIESNMHSSSVSSRVLPSSISPLDASQISSARTSLPNGTWALSAFPRLTPSQLSAPAKQYKKLGKRMVRSRKAKHDVKTSWKEELQVNDQRTNAWTSPILTPKNLFLEGSGIIPSNLDIKPAVLSSSSELRAERAEAALTSDPDNVNMGGSRSKVRAARQSRSLTSALETRNHGRQSFSVKDKGQKLAKSLCGEILTFPSRASQSETEATLSTTKVMRSGHRTSKLVKNRELQKSRVQSGESTFFDEVEFGTAEESTLSTGKDKGQKLAKSLCGEILTSSSRTSQSETEASLSTTKVTTSRHKKSKLVKDRELQKSRVQSGVSTFFDEVEFESAEESTLSSVKNRELQQSTVQSRESTFLEEGELETAEDSTLSSVKNQELRKSTVQSRESTFLDEGEFETAEDSMLSTVKNRELQKCRVQSRESTFFDEGEFETTEESTLSILKNRELQKSWVRSTESTFLDDSQFETAEESTLSSEGSVTELEATALDSKDKQERGMHLLDNVTLVENSVAGERRRDLAKDVGYHIAGYSPPSSTKLEPEREARILKAQREEEELVNTTRLFTNVSFTNTYSSDDGFASSGRRTSPCDNLNVVVGQSDIRVQQLEEVQLEKRVESTSEGEHDFASVRRASSSSKSPLECINEESKSTQVLDCTTEDEFQSGRRTRHHRANVLKKKRPRRKSSYNKIYSETSEESESWQVDQAIYRDIKSIANHGRTHANKKKGKKPVKHQGNSKESGSTSLRGGASAIEDSEPVNSLWLTREETTQNSKLLQVTHPKVHLEVQALKNLRRGKGKAPASDDGYGSEEEIISSREVSRIQRKSQSKVSKPVLSARKHEIKLHGKDLRGIRERHQPNSGIQAGTDLVVVSQESQTQESDEDLQHFHESTTWSETFETHGAKRSEKLQTTQLTEDEQQEDETGSEMYEMSRRPNGKVQKKRKRPPISGYKIGGESGESSKFSRSYQDVKTTRHKEVEAKHYERVPPPRKRAPQKTVRTRANRSVSRPVSEVSHLTNFSSGEDTEAYVERLHPLALQEKAICADDSRALELSTLPTEGQENHAMMDVIAPTTLSEVGDVNGTSDLDMSVKFSQEKESTSLTKCPQPERSSLYVNGRETTRADNYDTDTETLYYSGESDSAVDATKQSSNGIRKRKAKTTKDDLSAEDSMSSRESSENEDWKTSHDVKLVDSAQEKEGKVSVETLDSEMYIQEGRGSDYVRSYEVDTEPTYRSEKSDSVLDAPREISTMMNRSVDETTSPASCDPTDQIQGTAPISALVGETQSVSEVTEAQFDATSRRVEIPESGDEKRMDMTESNKMDQTDIENPGSERKIPHGETRSSESKVDVTSGKNNKGGLEQPVAEKRDLEIEVLQMETKTIVFEDHARSARPFVSFIDRSGIEAQVALQRTDVIESTKMEFDETTLHTSSDSSDPIHGVAPMNAIVAETQPLSEVSQADSDALSLGVEIPESAEEIRMDMMEDNKMDQIDIENPGFERKISHRETRSSESKVDVTSGKKNKVGLEQPVEEKPELESEVLQMETKITLLDGQTGSAGTFVSVSDRSGTKAQVALQRKYVKETMKMEFDKTTLPTSGDPTDSIPGIAPIDALVGEVTQPLSEVREADYDAPYRRVEIPESGNEIRTDMTEDNKMDQIKIELQLGSERKIPHGETRSSESKWDVTSRKKNKGGLEHDLESEVPQMETKSIAYDAQARSAGIRTFVSFSDRSGTEAQVASQRTDVIESMKIGFDETTLPTSSDPLDPIPGIAPIDALVEETQSLSEVREANSDVPARRVEILESGQERTMDMMEDNKMDENEIENPASERKIRHGETRSSESKMDMTSEEKNKGGLEQPFAEKPGKENEVLQMETKITVLDDQTGTFVSSSERSGTEAQLASQRTHLIESTKMGYSDGGNLIDASKVPHEKTIISAMKVYVTPENMTQTKVAIEQSNARELDSERKVGESLESIPMLVDQSKNSGVDEEFDVAETYVSYSEEFGSEVDVALRRRTDLIDCNETELGSSILFSDSKLPHETTTRRTDVGLTSQKSGKVEVKPSDTLELCSDQEVHHIKKKTSVIDDQIKICFLDDPNAFDCEVCNLKPTDASNEDASRGFKSEAQVQVAGTQIDLEAHVLAMASSSRSAGPTVKIIPNEGSGLESDHDKEASWELEITSAQEQISGSKNGFVDMVMLSSLEEDGDGRRVTRSVVKLQTTASTTTSGLESLNPALPISPESLGSESDSEETQSASTSRFTTPPAFEQPVPSESSSSKFSNYEAEASKVLTALSVYELSSSLKRSTAFNVMPPCSEVDSNGTHVQLTTSSMDPELFDLGTADPITQFLHQESLSSESAHENEISTVSSPSFATPPEHLVSLDGLRSEMDLRENVHGLDESTSSKNDTSGWMTPASIVEIGEERYTSSTADVLNVPLSRHASLKTGEKKEFERMRMLDLEMFTEIELPSSMKTSNSEERWVTSSTADVKSTDSEVATSLSKVSPPEDERPIADGKERVVSVSRKSAEDELSSTLMNFVEERKLAGDISRTPSISEVLETDEPNLECDQVKEMRRILDVATPDDESSGPKDNTSERMTPWTSTLETDAEQLQGSQLDTPLLAPALGLASGSSENFYDTKEKFSPTETHVSGEEKIFTRTPKTNLTHRTSSDLRVDTGPSWNAKVGTRQMRGSKRDMGTALSTSTSASASNTKLRPARISQEPGYEKTTRATFTGPRGVSGSKSVHEKKVTRISKNPVVKRTSSNLSSYGGRVWSHSSRVEAGIEHGKGRKNQLTSNVPDFKSEARSERDETKLSIKDFDSYIDTVIGPPLSNLMQIAQETKIEDLSEQASSSELVSRDQSSDRRLPLGDKGVRTVIQGFQAASRGLKSSTFGDDISLPRVDVLDSDAQDGNTEVLRYKTYDNGVPLSRSDLELESGVPVGGVAMRIVPRKRSDYGSCGLRKVTPLNLGLETAGGVMTVIIPRNTSVPVQRRQLISTHIDNQTELLVHIFEGERLWVRDNNLLGRFEVKGIAPTPRGVPRITVRFDIDARCVLNVFLEGEKTIGPRTMKRLAISNVSVRPDKHKILKMIQDADKHKAEDEENRRSIELKDSLENYVYKMRNIISDERIARLLDPGDKEQMMAAVHAKLEWLHVSNWFLYNQKQIAQFHEVDANRRDLQRICDPILERLFRDQGHAGSLPPATHWAD